MSLNLTLTVIVFFKNTLLFLALNKFEKLNRVVGQGGGAAVSL